MSSVLLLITMPKISVVIPTFNRENSLPHAIRSVLSQTYQNWELLVVDDGSTDRTAEVMRDFLHDTRIKYFYQANSGGPAKPRNIGISHATGEFVAFLDSDDIFLPAKLEEQLKLFFRDRSGRLGFVGCNANVVRDGCVEDVYRLYDRGDVFERLLQNNFILSCTNILVRKEILLRAGGFDETLRYLDDWDMWIRVAATGSIFDFVDLPLFSYCLHESNITKNFNSHQILLEKERIILKQDSFFEDACKVYSFSIQLFFAGEYVKAKKYIKKAIVLSPFVLKYNYVYLLLLLGPLGFRVLYATFKIKRLILRLLRK